MTLSIIIPTYNEKENVLSLLKEVRDVLEKEAIIYELIVVDDNSPDGTGGLLEEYEKKLETLKVLRRGGKLGLSSAVLAGVGISAGEIIAVMDADFSHPVNVLPKMYKYIVSRNDLVIGSRYVAGGKIEGWGIFRKLQSRIATLLARCYVDVSDPLSGFFMVRKSSMQFENHAPNGFKILMDLLVNGSFVNIKEIPIIFVNRKIGKSKAGLREIIFFLGNLVSYLPHHKNFFIQIIKFGAVGVWGLILNLFILYVFTEKVEYHYLQSSVIAFVCAMTSNFLLNKTWTFQDGLKNNIFSKYLRFVEVSLMAFAVNFVLLYVLTEWLGIYYIVSQVIGVGASFLINFVGNKIWTFKKAYHHSV